MFNYKLFYISLLSTFMFSCSDKTFLRDPYAWKEVEGTTTVINKGRPYEDTIAVLTHRINVLSKKLAKVSEEEAGSTDSTYTGTKYPSTYTKYPSHYPYYTKGKYEVEYSRLREGGPVQKEFYRIYTNFKKGYYNFAIIEFNRFLKKYPYHYLNDDAVFFIAEGYYRQKEYFLAIDEYKKLITKYPSSGKLSEAILKLAISYRRVNDRSSAKKYYREVIRRFPKTREANIARRQIATL